MDEEIKKRFDEQEAKLEAIFVSVEKTRNYIRNYIKWTLIISILFVVLPLIGLAFVIPQFLSTLNPANLGL